VAAGLPVPEPELRRALDMVWDALAGERGVSGRHPSGTVQHEGAAEAQVIASPDALRWPAVRERLMSQVAPDDWNTWLAPLDLLDVVDGAAVIAVPNLFVRSEVSARFETLLAAALGAELAQDLRIELVIATPAPAQWQQAHITTEALLCQV
jgi:hypothetical protein